MLRFLRSKHIRADYRCSLIRFAEYGFPHKLSLHLSIGIKSLFPVIISTILHFQHNHRIQYGQTLHKNVISSC